MVSPTLPPANRRFHDETGKHITPGRKLGEGGEGAVFLVNDQPGSVMKIWHPGRTPPDADAKLSHLLSNPVRPDLGASWQITWPQHLVRENGVTVGYTMPILDPGQSWEPIVDYYNRRAAQNTEQEQGRELRIDDRVRMARNLALGFRAVHDAGYVIGDVNEKNVEVNRQNDIAMVDCDSYGFTDPRTGRTFSNRMGRAEFQAPEVPEATTPTEPRTATDSAWPWLFFTAHRIPPLHSYEPAGLSPAGGPYQSLAVFAGQARREHPGRLYDAAWNALDRPTAGTVPPLLRPEGFTVSPDPRPKSGLKRCWRCRTWSRHRPAPLRHRLRRVLPAITGASASRC